MTTTDCRRQALGAYGEEIAARYLVGQGMVLLDRNWHGEGGELDLVLREGATLVVAEVKTRGSDQCGSPHEAITPTKLGRLRRLAAQWIQTHAASPEDVRLDLVAVWRPQRGASRVEHVKGLG